MGTQRSEGNKPDRSTDLDRRALLRRASVAGAAVVWAAPTVQSLMTPAFAAGSTPTGNCTACMTGGGQIVDYPAGTVTYHGQEIAMLSFGVGQICCTDPGNGNAEPQIEVNAHKTTSGGKNSILQTWHFDRNLVLQCSRNGNPAPPPDTADCANDFKGTADDAYGNRLSFTFIDNGEPGTMVDRVTIVVTDGLGMTVLAGTGLLARGNLQVHSGLAGLTRDCSGC